MRPRCDDDCPAPPACPSPWAHPLVVGVVTAIATAAAQAIGEVWVSRNRAQSPRDEGEGEQ